MAGNYRSISMGNLGEAWIRYRNFNCRLDDVPILDLDRLRGRLEFIEEPTEREVNLLGLLEAYLSLPKIHEELEKEIDSQTDEETNDFSTKDFGINDCPF